MLNLIVLFTLTALFYFWLKRRLDKGFSAERRNYEELRRKYPALEEEYKKIKEDNSILLKDLEGIIALYEATKQICRNLNIDNVFSAFKKQVNKYIDAGDCRFLKPDADLGSYKGYMVLPLEIDNKPIGFLAVRRLNDKDKDKFYILAQQFLLGIKRALLYQRVNELAVSDTLTGASSRRYCLERLDEEMLRSKKMKYNFSLLMIDIDHFKDFNDRYGHLVGDAILKEVARVIKENIRQIDLFGRYGGEEFLVILPETDKEQARFAAERIRQTMEQAQVQAYDENLKVTVSVGISGFAADAQDAAVLIDKADQALYQAKNSGRNKVCVWLNGLNNLTI